ncbi:hypothetical protein AB0H87_00005, partial [Asanoa sp. NPDC050611]
MPAVVCDEKTRPADAPHTAIPPWVERAAAPSRLALADGAGRHRPWAPSTGAELADEVGFDGVTVSAHARRVD